jgi:hypothetical protein
VKETKEVYEGELTELTPTEAENPLSGYGKTISHVVVGLKTVKGTKQLRLDPTIYEAIQKERVVVGDVIYIEANTGAVKVRLRELLLPSGRLLSTAAENLYYCCSFRNPLGPFLLRPHYYLHCPSFPPPSASRPLRRLRF